MAKKKPKCGDCKDYFVCKSDSKVRGKYLPWNKTACEEFIPAEQFEATYEKVEN